MDVLGPELPRHRLGHGLQAEFGRGKRRIALPAPAAGSRAGEEDLALAARQHQPRRFPPRHEAREAGHFPDLAKHPVGCLQNWEVHIGPDIEHGQRQRGERIRFVQEGRHVIGLARVQGPGRDAPARGLDLLNERCQLFAVSPPSHDCIAFSGKLLRDLGADIVARPDNGDGLVPVFHARFSPAG